MNAELTVVTPWIPKDTLHTERVWEETRPVDIEPRNFVFTLLRHNPNYEAVIEPLKALVSTGDLGEFTVLSPRLQLISSDVNISRKVLVTHPLYPDDMFIIGGIGPVRMEEGRLHIYSPDVSATIHTKHTFAPSLMATGYIHPDGRVEERKNDEPYGGYWVETAVKKYEKTEDARATLPSSKNVCDAVVAGSITQNSQETGIFVYRLPRSAQSLAEYYVRDHDYWHREVLLPLANGKYVGDVVRLLSYGQAAFHVHTAMGLLEYLHTKDKVHRQYHVGNVYTALSGEREGEQNIIVTDWDTSGDIGSYSRLPAIKYDKIISPYDEVRWHDVENAVNGLSNIHGPDSYYSLWKMSLSIVAIMGYKHSPYGDEQKIEELYDQMVDEYGDLYGSRFGGDILDLDQNTMIERVHKVAKNVMTIELTKAGYFPSLLSDR